ncbi:hypothetical protein GKZ28_01230 [Clostridium chromiireducens]|uniref:Uncharacterized protein n=1 Tax=Clostridium chromiireducens TaxID=225345 RepID=A0A964RII8_9CLOT|nr:hypothetical protein [Clostridium chromiireducens]MVX62322.1 hypothetical protein [Clostridium chromiireducens]
MIRLFTAFATGEDFFYEGAFIAKVKYQRFNETTNSESFKNEIIKNNKKLCIIECIGYNDTEIIEKLTVYLMMNIGAKEPMKSDTSEIQGVLWRSFSKEEIAEFSHTTGDTNSIHLTDNPVVQGLFILKELCDTTKVTEIEIKYIHPVYGDNPVYILREENIIKGFSNGFLCFQATV